MTTANIFSVGKSSNVYGALGAGSKADAKQAAEEAAEIFGAVMNQMSQELSSMQSDSDFEKETLSVSTDMDSAQTQYDYSPKENRIEKAIESDPNAKREDFEREVEELTEEATEIICEKLNVSKEELLYTMEELGISAEELLIPEKLGQLIMELTGETDVFNLLMNSDFQAILQEITGMEKDVAVSLGMNLNQFQESLQEMNQSGVEQQLGLETAEAEQMTVVDENRNISQMDHVSNESLVMEDVETSENPDVAEQKDLVQNVTQQDGVKSKQDLMNGETDAVDMEDIIPEEEDVLESVTQTNHSDSKEESLSGEKISKEGKLSEETVSWKLEQSKDEGTRKKDLFGGQNQQHGDGAASGNTLVGETTNNVMVEENFSDVSYSNIDVDDLIQQFVEKTHITVMENKTTMDMQLNPENLGKIYLHISTEEGNVQAQITATNEIVKEALEVQLATLRENLNQAGVKVDSVDISVATHEFEQNLEQNSKQEEEQARMQEENSRTRRNLNMNSLDELAGVLSEEEVLVAQMMRDHGNSVDFTA